MTTEIEVYVDLVCPFCFLVEDAIEEVERERDVEVTIKPFELRPDPVPTLRPEDDYLPRIWEQSVYPMAERLGFDITLPTVSPQPRTEKAFLVLQVAQEAGLAEAYTAAMFAAFFQQDRDIGEDEVIIDVATSVGLPRRDVEAALHDEGRLERHRRTLAEAVHEVGIDVVPSILVDGELVRGVPSARRLKQVIDRKAAERRQQVSP